MADGQLDAIARACRVQIIRMLTHAGSGHPGGSLSVIDLLVTIVFGRLRHDPRRPDWADRDRIVLSKGHAVPALYTVMARAGYFPESQLVTLRQLGSPLQGHPDRVALPGIEAATGSLGQGLSISLGMALGLKLARSPARVYCILGDGEIQEGQVWEAAMAGPKRGRLARLSHDRRHHPRPRRRAGRARPEVDEGDACRPKPLAPRSVKHWWSSEPATTASSRSTPICRSPP